MVEIIFMEVENIVGKEENAGYKTQIFYTKHSINIKYPVFTNTLQKYTYENILLRGENTVQSSMFFFSNDYFAT